MKSRKYLNGMLTSQSGTITVVKETNQAIILCLYQVLWFVSNHEMEKQLAKLT
jgi:hypothetical protein